MMGSVIVRPQAEAEVTRAFSWYEDRRSGLGGEFAAAVADLVGRITENPLAEKYAARR